MPQKIHAQSLQKVFIVCVFTQGRGSDTLRKKLLKINYGKMPVNRRHSAQPSD